MATDGELLMRFRRHGDQEAFAQVVERHRAMIWSVCTRVLVRQADAEDAYQATLLILAKKAGSIRANDSAGGWLFRVAHNAALGALRRRKALRETSLDQASHEPEAAFPDLEQKQLVVSLLEELRAMPTKYQTALVLRYLEGHSRREIAAAMDTTVATVAGHLVRGRRMLRSRLARRGVSLGLVLGALGGASVGHAGTIHSAPPAFGPALLSSGASATVSSLVNQGVRTMFYTSVLKPAALGAATTVAAAALLLAPPAGGADDRAEATLALGAALEEGGAQENDDGAAVRLSSQPAKSDASRATADRPEVTGKVTATFEAVDSEGMRKAFASQRARYAKLAAEDAFQDYESASFEELYWQHQHWVYRQDMLVDRMKALDRKSRELAKGVSQGSVPRSAYEANQTLVLENRAEIPLAKAKIAEHERLLKQAALREVAGQEKAADNQAASAGRGRGRRPDARDDTPVEIFTSDGFDARRDPRERANPYTNPTTQPYGAGNRTPASFAAPTTAPRQSASPSGEIQPGETLKIEAIDTLSGSGFFDHFDGSRRSGVSFSRDFQVDGSGEVALGARLGRVRVAGLTVAEAEKAIKDAVSDRLDRLDALKREAAEAEGRTHKPFRYQLEVQVTRRVSASRGMHYVPNAANVWQRGNQSSWTPALTPTYDQPDEGTDSTPEPNRKRSRGYGGGGEYGGGAEYGGGGYGGEFGGTAKPKPNQGLGVPAKQRR
ncbi:ECF RNA polymerase sigma factor SigW [Planctomycetes bacterium MalM25]|nr:ECF RNA polymerase sigma factor SigW [Planctomycetes bacterium MalM25]